MKDLDLDIRNYSIPDLERFFQVSDVKYDAALLEQKKRNWSDKVATIVGLDAPFRTQFRAFLQESVKILLEQKAYFDAQPNKDIYGVPARIVKQEDMDKYQKPVISKPEIPFVYSRNSEYYAGTMNPIDRHLSSRILSIHSLFRDVVPKKECTDPIVWTSVSDFIFKFPEPFKQVASLELVSIELPTLYDVSAKHKSNSFLVNGIQIVVPDGNYTEAQMETCIQGLLVAASLSFIVFQIEGSSGLASFASSSTTFSLDFMTANANIYENMGWKLGFRQYAYNGAINVPVIGEVPYTLFSDQYIFLEIDDFNRNNQTNAIMAQTSDAFFISNNILARISLQELQLQGVTRIYKKREYFGSVRLEKLRIRLLNKFGKPLDMHGADYSMALEVKQIYA